MAGLQKEANLRSLFIRTLFDYGTLNGENGSLGWKRSFIHSLGEKTSLHGIVGGGTGKCASREPEERDFKCPKQRGHSISYSRRHASFIPCGLAWTTCQEAQSQTFDRIINS